MRVYDVTLRRETRVLSEDSNVVVLSIDGEHAHMIIEKDSVQLVAYTPDDPEFTVLAEAYGFKLPKRIQLPS
jgi:hypothetical protein